MLITFSSCFYIINSKNCSEKYIEWMNNFISIVNNFYLVIYTDENTSKYINTKNNPKIKVIIKSLSLFYNYKYKEYWIKNHEKNFLLNDKSCWQLNMLWAEKISFVKETIERKYYDTEYYGWCDIGYFRNRIGQYNDLHTNDLFNWPDNNKINKIPINKILYACINNNNQYLNCLINTIIDKNSIGLPAKPIPNNQLSIAGGFFILHKNLINIWFSLFDNKLLTYFENDYLVKDDQIILADCIFSNQELFILFRENNYLFDNWFMFQRLFK
jgi:hypothetical protein